jgi:hypothetical protein
MTSTTYRRRDGLAIDKQADDWAIIHPPGDHQGVALDPLIFAIWSATEGQATTELAQSLHIPTYLASCALAVLQRAGLLQASTLNPQPQPSILNLNVQPLPIEAENVHLIQRDDWACALSERLPQMEAQAVLLLDSRVRLSTGALSEMTHTLTLRDDIAAVAPRVIWESWPRFVVHAGKREGANGCTSYAGHLDVGQFKRWREVHSIHPAGGLLRREALQKVEISSEAAPEQAMKNWSHRIRWQGYHILSALQAIAYGPWPNDLTHEDDALTLYKGQPALTVENVRGLYSHYAAITPLSLRQNTAAELRLYTSYAFAEASELVSGGDGDPLRSLQPVSSEPTPLRALPGKAWRILRRQGFGGVAREVRRYIRWKIGG